MVDRDNNIIERMLIELEAIRMNDQQSEEALPTCIRSGRKQVRGFSLRPQDDGGEYQIVLVHGESRWRESNTKIESITLFGLKRAKKFGKYEVDYVCTCELFTRSDSCEHKMGILNSSKGREKVGILCYFFAVSHSQG